MVMQNKVLIFALWVLMNGQYASNMQDKQLVNSENVLPLVLSIKLASK